MRSFAAILLFFLMVLLLTAALAPQISPWFSSVPLEKMLRHVGRLFLLIGFFLMVRLLGVNNKRDLGYETTRSNFLAQTGYGWLTGLLLLGVLVALLWLLEIKYFTHGMVSGDYGMRFFQKLISGMFTGLLVGILEETFFRGMVYSAVRKESGIAAAVLLSSALYAAMHFLVAAPLPAGSPLIWSSGLSLLPSVGSNLLDPRHLDSFIALFTAGALLALAREYSGNIALAVGIHAGWVTVIKLAKYLLDTNPSSEMLWLVGDYDGISGLLGAALLALTALPLIHWIRLRENNHSDS